MQHLPHTKAVNLDFTYINIWVSAGSGISQIRFGNVFMICMDSFTAKKKRENIVLQIKCCHATSQNEGSSFVTN